MTDTARGFIEIGSDRRFKDGQNIGGDTFLCRRSANGERTISVLSDGLGSGVKAGVLSTLTATMAVNCIERNVPIERTARIIMETLPVCRTRRISYATFTIVDINRDGVARVIEYDNPTCVWLRGGELYSPPRTTVEVERKDGTRARLHFSEMKADIGDRIVFFSDGVSQSGMGTPAHPLGWGEEGVRSSLSSAVSDDPGISAVRLAGRLVAESARMDAYRAHDDITCGVIYFRSPRRLLVASGPPLDPGRDGELAERIRNFDGRRIVAGGTTGNIVAREFGVHPRISMGHLDPEVPPYASMDGVEMVTEGIITLARTAEYLETGTPPEQLSRNAAGLLTEYLLDSDSIEFVVGTRINQAHQDPNVPVQLELRRAAVQRLADILKREFLKEISISYL